MTGAEEVARIAKGLTKAQRQFLKEVPRSCVATYPPFKKLEDLGLVAGKEGRFGSHLAVLTDVGTAVRDLLLREGGDA